MEGRASGLEPAVINIWTWFLDQPVATVRRCASLLSADEIERANRFLAPRDAHRYVIARSSLRSILAAYLEIRPEHVALSYNDFGKPHLAAPTPLPPLQFNLSHSGQFAVLAVSDQFPLGIDIEEVGPLKEDIAAHFFSAKEQIALSGLPLDKYLRGFYRCWTRKEAIVKGRGQGLSLALDAFDVSVGARATVDLSRLDEEFTGNLRWRLWNVKTPPGFEGALAVLVDGRRVQLRYHSELHARPLTSPTVHQRHTSPLLHRSDDSRSAPA